MNDWKRIWEKRKDLTSEIDLSDNQSILKELMIIDGFDIPIQTGG